MAANKETGNVNPSNCIAKKTAGINDLRRVVLSNDSTPTRMIEMMPLGIISEQNKVLKKTQSFLR